MERRVRKSLGQDRWLTHYWYDNLNAFRELSAPYRRDQRAIDMYYDAFAELQHDNHLTRNPRTSINYTSCPNQAWCISLVNTIDSRTFNYHQQLSVQFGPGARFKPLSLMEMAASKLIKSARSYDIPHYWAEKIFDFIPGMEIRHGHPFRRVQTEFTNLVAEIIMTHRLSKRRIIYAFDEAYKVRELSSFYCYCMHGIRNLCGCRVCLLMFAFNGKKKRDYCELDFHFMRCNKNSYPKYPNRITQGPN